MAKYTIHTSEGRLPVRPIAKLEYLGESFFLHVHHQDRNQVGITHIETGLSAGKLPRYHGYRSMGMKREAVPRERLLIDAAVHLSRVPEGRFRAAMAKARGEV